MADGFFVTGTDTNVGKTVLSALLCAALPARYWKPIQTGSSEGTDREQVMRWSGLGDDDVEDEAYIFQEPVSPHLAAQRTGKTISLEKIVPAPARRSAPLVVEGAGGVMVPVNESEYMADLMRRIGFPVILAARSTLGTINHTLLSLQVLRNRNLNVRGVVMLGTPDHDNRKAIEHYGETPVIGQVPILHPITPHALRCAFAKYFDRAAFS